MYINIKHLLSADYSTVFAYMRRSVDWDERHELLCVEHKSVYTYGLRQKGSPTADIDHIPVVQTDRGGLTTYHGPGQIVFYPLVHLQSLATHPTDFIHIIENITIRVLAKVGLKVYSDPQKPGLYIEGKKIASVGLRAKHHRSYHGIAINHDMDLSVFDKIIPCGYDNIEMTQISAYIDVSRNHLTDLFIQELADYFSLDVHYDRQTT